jgi:hypothetical protein
MPLVETSKPNNVPANEIIIGKHMLKLNSNAIQALEILAVNQDLQFERKRLPILYLRFVISLA